MSAGEYVVRLTHEELLKISKKYDDSGGKFNVLHYISILRNSRHYLNDAYKSQRL